MLRPQQYATPPMSSAQVCALPTLSEEKRMVSPTRTGVVLFAPTSLPSCPYSLRPQQSTAPSVRSAHVCALPADRKSTRLNSSHVKISYAVFCLKKKNSLMNFNYQ